MLVDPSASKAVAVTPDDNTDLTKPSGVIGTKYLYVGVSGDVVVVTSGGDTATLKALSAGVFHPIQVKRVKSTGTTATSILAVY
jgi:hypothetical protein